MLNPSKDPEKYTPFGSVKAKAAWKRDKRQTSANQIYKLPCPQQGVHHRMPRCISAATDDCLGMMVENPICTSLLRLYSLFDSLHMHNSIPNPQDPGQDMTVLV